MELAVERNQLMNALALVQGIVERRNTVPILGHVLIEPKGATFQICATDLEVGVRSEVPCRTGKGGSITLNARKLFEVVREAAADEVSLKTLDGDWVELRCGRARFKMMGLDPRSFPAMPNQNGAGKGEGEPHKAVKGSLAIASSMLAEMIDKTIFAVSPDETRYSLSGVYIESAGDAMARLVATDGHRLAMIEREAPGFVMQGGAIVPRKGLTELRKLLDREGDSQATLALDGQLAWLKRGATEISMRLVEGEFPDYLGVIPKSSKYQIRIDRDVLLAAVRRAAIFSNERYHGVKVTMSAGTLTISSTSVELGEASESVDVEFTGQEFSIGFNASYLTQVLGVMPPEDVFIGLSDEASPGVLTTEKDSGYTYVVMPMRL